MNELANISEEQFLLTGLCRMKFDENLKSILAGKAAGLSGWRSFAKLANDHGVAALVYDNLDKTGILGHVPEETASFLRNALFMSLARNAANMKMVQEALAVLKPAGIRPILLKGMALELTVYGNRGLRQMSDADVLIGREVIKKAHKELVKAGFVPLPVKSIFHRPILPYIGKHLPSLVKNGFLFELHHNLFGRNNEDLTIEISGSPEEVFQGDRTFLVPAPGLLFLYLVKHLVSHERNNESQLRLYTDLVVLIEKYGERILNEELIGKAEIAGITVEIATRLWILKEFWRMAFPGWLEGYIEKYKDAAFIEKFLFFLRSPKGNPVPDRSQPYRNVIRNIPGIHRKALYILGDLFPTLNFMKKRYRCSSVFKTILYYPHRFGKLIWLMRRGQRKFRSVLRNNSTSAEAVLWNLLKARKIEGKKFRRQHGENI